MPEEVYSVQRDNGQVFVFRIITDWRNDSDRKKPIEIKKEDDIYGKTEKKMSPDTFLGEYYLYGKGKDRLREFYKMPSYLGEYISSLKDIAEKMAKGEAKGTSEYTLNISQELRVINRYGESLSHNTRVEGQATFQDDKDREWVKKVPFADFNKKMKEARSRVVQVEGTNVSKEGQQKYPGEGDDRTKWGDEGPGRTK